MSKIPTATDDEGVAWVPIGYDADLAELLLIPTTTTVKRVPIGHDDAELAEPEVIEGRVVRDETVAGSE